MNRILSKVAPAAAMLALFACSDSKSVTGPTTSSSVSQVPSATLSANYSKTLTAAEIKTDLTDIATLGSSLSSVTTGINSGSSVSPIASASLGSKAKLAKHLVAGYNLTTGCVTVDTTYTDTLMGDTTNVSIKMVGSNGSLLSICPAGATTASAVIAKYNAATIISTESTYTPNAVITSKSQLKYNITMNSKDSITGMKFNMAGSMNEDVSKPKAFNLYAEYDITMDMTSIMSFDTTSMDTSSTDSFMTGTMTLYFKAGTYKCVFDVSKLESSNESCDLSHNNVSVGTLSDDGYGDLVVTDINGKTVPADSTITGF